MQIQLSKSKNKAPEGTELLSQGKDEIEINFSFNANSNDWRKRPSDIYYTAKVKCTWDEIFSEISPLLIDEASESSIRAKVNDLIRKKRLEDLTQKLEKEERNPTEFKIEDNDFQTLKIQLRALGLMTESIKKRGVHDKNKYWIITPFGDNLMTKLRAIKK